MDPIPRAPIGGVLPVMIYQRIDSFPFFDYVSKCNTPFSIKTSNEI
jgi:hypothetical protein